VPQKYGQHFLINGSILDRIAAAACPERAGLVIEIGPGKGALTDKLLRRAARVVAVELDPFMVDHLRQKYAGEPRLEIVLGDVLQTDLTQWGPAPITGNLPYYITSPILSKALRIRAPRAVFLVQKEVALRIAAHPGERDYGYLTVQTASLADARYLFEVKPGSFRPPPKVDSAVVLLEPRREPLPVDDHDAFLRFVGLCFHQKRKTLRNNLSEAYGKDRVSAWPEAGLRAEQIPLEGFVAMFHRLV
jgi:16S rRNA (adenine1518-N6/adenine1519-N6)-dimethyltransferase